MQTLGRENAKIAIDFLNDLLAKDPVMLNSIMNHYVNCNDEIMDHPTVQVDGDRVGILGILNGLFGIIDGDSPRKNWGHISAMLKNGSEIIRFQLTEEN